MRPIANQKKITIIKEVVEKESGKSRPYMISYVDTIEKAGQDLKNTAFKVYMYLLTNQNGFYFGLSPQDIANRYGVSIDAVRDAIKQLEEKGYLDKTDEDEYFFYDRLDKKPVELAEEVEINNEKRYFHSKSTGEKVAYTYKEILDAYGAESARRIWERGGKE